MVGKIWYGMGYRGVVPYHGMGWYPPPQIPYHTAAKRYGILCSTSGKLSLFRQCANCIKYALAILGLAYYLALALIPYQQVVWYLPPGDPIPVPYRGINRTVYTMVYIIPFRLLSLTTYYIRDYSII